MCFFTHQDVGNDCYQITKGTIGFYEGINHPNKKDNWWTRDNTINVKTFDFKDSKELLEFFKNKKLSREQELKIQQLAFEVFV